MSERPVETHYYTGGAVVNISLLKSVAAFAWVNFDEATPRGCVGPVPGFQTLERASVTAITRCVEAIVAKGRSDDGVRHMIYSTCENCRDILTALVLDEANGVADTAWQDLDDWDLYETLFETLREARDEARADIHLHWATGINAEHECLKRVRDEALSYAATTSMQLAT